jgi:hypothetical protein
MWVSMGRENTKENLQKRQNKILSKVSKKSKRVACTVIKESLSFNQAVKTSP